MKMNCIKNLLKLCLVLFFLSGELDALSQSVTYDTEIEAMANSISELMKKNEKSRIVITDFNDVAGEKTELGIDIVNDLESYLSILSSNIRIISRKELNRILEEQKISRSDITEKNNVVKIGQISNAEIIAVGSISDRGGIIRVNVKLIEVKSSEIIGGAMANIPSSDLFQKKLETVILDSGRKIFNGSPINSVSNLDLFRNSKCQETRTGAIRIINKSSFPITSTRLYYRDEEGKRIRYRSLEQQNISANGGTFTFPNVKEGLVDIHLYISSLQKLNGKHIGSQSSDDQRQVIRCQISELIIDNNYLAQSFR